VREGSAWPSSVATQPGLVFSGTTSSCGVDRAGTSTVRCSASQTGVASATGAAGVGPAPPRVSVAETTVNAAAGLVSTVDSACSPAASRPVSPAPHAVTGTGFIARRSATLARNDVGTVRPSIATAGPLPHGRSTTAAGSGGASPGTSISPTPTPTSLSWRV
jgi:hypothetical protein